MKTDPQMRLRLPPDLKAFVVEQAERDASSQNSVVVRAVRAMAATQTKDRPEAVTSDRSDTNPTHPSKDRDHGKSR